MLGREVEVRQEREPRDTRAAECRVDVRRRKHRLAALHRDHVAVWIVLGRLEKHGIGARAHGSGQHDIREEPRIRAVTRR